MDIYICNKTEVLITGGEDSLCLLKKKKEKEAKERKGKGSESHLEIYSLDMGQV